MKNYGLSFIGALIFKKYYDIVFTRSVYLYIIACLLAPRKTVYLEVHKQYLSHRALINKILLAITAHLSKNKKNKIVYISGALKRHYDTHLFQSDSIVLHDAVDQFEYSRKESINESKKRVGWSSAKVVTYAGSLKSNRGIQEFISGYASKINCQVKIIGGPDCESKKIYEIIKEKKINNVDVIGYVNKKDLSDYLLASDVLLLISTDKVPWVRYFSPMKLFEYMATGNVIVSYAYPTIKEVVTDGEEALLARVNDKDHVVELINKAVSNKLEVGKNAREKVLKDYTWEARARKLVNHSSGG